jgi:hypothetical protein
MLGHLRPMVGRYISWPAQQIGSTSLLLPHSYLAVGRHRASLPHFAPLAPVPVHAAPSDGLALPPSRCSPLFGEPPSTSAVAAMVGTLLPSLRRHQEEVGTGPDFVSRGGRTPWQDGRPAHARPFALCVSPRPELAGYHSPHKVGHARS